MKVGRLAATAAALAVFASAGTAAVSPDPAKAGTDVPFCYTSAAYRTWCPGFYSLHARHTYKNNRVSWGTVIKPGCNHNLVNGSYVAYGSSNGGLKYSAQACNYVVDNFENNTELLRPYGAHYTNGAVYLAGRAFYY